MLRWVLHLFSFFGRARRREYWLAMVPVNALIGATSYFIARNEQATTAVLAVVMVLLLIGLVLNIALGVRRLHDRDRRGWWLVAMYGAPFAAIMGRERMMAALGSGWDAPISLTVIGCLVWGIIELGVLPGAPGPNRHGGLVDARQVADTFD